MARVPRYRLADTAQQIVGGFLLAGPFVVAIVFGIGYGALYQADSGRDPDEEAEVAGIPIRFLSLMAVSYGAVAVLALALDAPRTFLVEGTVLEDPGTREVVATTAKAVAVGAIFSVVGAATADSVF